MAQRTLSLPIVPASFFGMVLGLVGLGSSWRAAHAVWGLPTMIGESLMLAGGVVWIVLILLFAAKWILARDQALAEARHPVQCCFIGLVGVATILAGIALEPYARGLALALLAAGAAFTVGFAVWRTGGLWQGERDAADNTPVLYLPTVAGNFVIAIACGTLGFAQWGQLAFGAGLLSWLAIESVLVHRYYTVPGLPPALRPTLGIQLAPPAVGAVAYLAVTSGPPNLIVIGLVGYALLQVLVLARLSRWLFAAGFTASAWSFSFGLTALATALVKMVGRGATGPAALLAPSVLAAVSISVTVLVLRTLWLLVSRRLLPIPQPAVSGVTTPSTPPGDAAPKAVASGPQVAAE